MINNECSPTFSDIDCLDLKTGRWTELAPIGIPCWGLAVLALPSTGCIYAIGGGTDHTSYATVERYDIARNEWTSAAPMSVARHGNAHVVYGEEPL